MSARIAGLAAIFLIAVVVAPAAGQAHDEELRKLRDQVKQLQAQVDELTAKAKSTRRTAIVTAVARARNAVVNITTDRATNPADPLFISPLKGMGTGIVIDPRGYIVTNDHVVDEVASLQVSLPTGKKLKATVVARNAKLDLAIIKIDPPTPLAIMPLGTSSDLMVGETVVAIGNAWGYESTASMGIISAIKRDVTLNKELTYKALIQTDASISPGNSGGPLVNIHGELVGVNVAIRAGAQGIGFAIPVDHMVPAVAEMLRKARPTAMGFDSRDQICVSDERLIRSVCVDNVSGPASTAGLHKGDVLLRVGDVKVESSIDVERGLLGRKVGEAVLIVVRSKDQEKAVRLVLAARSK